MSSNIQLTSHQALESSSANPFIVLVFHIPGRVDSVPTPHNTSVEISCLCIEEDEEIFVINKHSVPSFNKSHFPLSGGCCAEERSTATIQGGKIKQT